MSDFTAIRGVSLTLKELLRQAITLSSDPQLNGVPISSEAAPPESPDSFH